MDQREFERRIQEALQEAAAQRQLADDERQRRQLAEEKQQQAEERQQQAKEKQQQAQEKLQLPLQIQNNKALSTKGTVTVPRDRYCPTHLRPWVDYSKRQRKYFKRAAKGLQSSEKQPLRLFASRESVQSWGQQFDRKLSSEQDLAVYLRIAVENQVSNIVREFGLRNPEQFPIEFENHPNTLDDRDDEVRVKRRQITAGSSNAAADSRGLSIPDQYVVYTTENGARRLLLHIEYKPAHKLSTGNLRAGLRPMNLPKEVLDRNSIPTDLEEKLQYNADRLTACVVTQAYSAMMESGTEYGFITTGLAFVFLQVKKDKPDTVYYHVSEPNADVPARLSAKGEDRSLSETSVAQVLSFCLMAFKSHPRGQQWRLEATKDLRKWAPNYNRELSDIPEAERSRSPSAAYAPSEHSIDPPSPIMTRSRTKALTGCDPRELEGGPAPPSDSDSSQPGPAASRSAANAANPQVATTTAVVPRAAGGNERPARTGQEKQRARPYCTQQCLLGLARGLPLDDACPNVLLHRHVSSPNEDSNRHPLGPGVTAFASLAQQQIAADPDHDIEPMGKQGARGALFKLTLVTHGYTFVGKGTIDVFVDELQHEGAIYRDHLQKLQGHAVPVYLGNIDLESPYFLCKGVLIIHMLLMSWAGEEVNRDPHRKRIRHLEIEIARTTKEVLQAGVQQGDLRRANMLWNWERKRVMLIDYERATVDPTPGAVVAAPAEATATAPLPPVHISPNLKRKHCEGHLEAAPLSPPLSPPPKRRKHLNGRGGGRTSIH
ncbi:MAG: hypothetical protein M1826_000817 [Phylliscum demangeonii]|nr:MAG: hypothetical protein M1826_000817 [Phylliscum demangeonii]